MTGFRQDLALARMERLAAQWLERRAGGRDTQDLDRRLEQARREFRRAERRDRRST